MGTEMNSAGKKQLRAANGDMLQKRMVVVFFFIVILFVLLVLRIGWIQIVATDKYASLAAESQTKDEIIPARRGEILDRNMKELAVSKGSYRLYARLKPYGDQEVDELKMREQKDKVVSLLSIVQGIDTSKLVEQLESDESRVLIARDIDKNLMDIIRPQLSKNEITIIEVEEDIDREYPKGAFASQLLGTVGTDGMGKNGIEYQYNEYLSGISGRKIENTDALGNSLSSGKQIKYDEQDGLDVVLTIDETIQYYVEAAIKKTYDKTKPVKVTAIVMDPKTGDILANAEYPEFDPNNPSVPSDPAKLVEFDGLTDEQQSEHLINLWKSSAVCDLYEPGSVFKLITVASALENGAITVDSELTCKGSTKVEDRKIQCHVYPAKHGKQNVTQAVGNSCNPAMLQIIEQMGYEKFKQYLDLFGITERANVDYPGEAAPIIQNEEISGSVGLATMSFGMGLSITPVQMITAVSAIGNEGKMMQPRLVKGLADNEGNMVEEYKPTIVRQVISKQTSEEVKSMMEYVLDNLTGKQVEVAGYKIGGKTGTAQKLINGKYTDEIVGSMIAMAPMKDPQFVVLVVVDEPKKGKTGQIVAGPAVQEISTEILRYLNVKPEYTKSELKKISKAEITVPNVTNKTFEEAEKTLTNKGIKFVEQGNDGDKSMKIVDQYPKAGSKMEKDVTIYLYAK